MRNTRKKSKLYLVILLFLISNLSCSAQKTIWGNAPGLQTGRAFHSMSVVGEKLYVMGGFTGNFSALKSVEMYDLNSNKWVYKAEMPKPGILSAGVSVGNKIFLIGGEDEKGNKQKTTYLYNCDSDKWYSKSPMNVARTFHSAVLLNNKIYAIGGRENNTEINSKPKDSLAVYTIEEYDIEKDAWTIKAKLPFKHFAIGAATLDNKIYILSDTISNNMNDESSILEEYDPQNNSFKRLAKLTPSKCDAAMVSYNNKIYVFGGWNNGPLSTVEEYNPATDKWSEKNRMPYISQNLQAQSYNNAIYVSGGTDYSGPNDKRNNVIIYNPDNDITSDIDTKGQSSFEIFPNPVFSMATFSFSIKKEGPVSLKIFDAKGKHIETIIEQNIYPGNYGINWDLKNLKPGLYYCHLIICNLVESKKLIVN